MTDPSAGSGESSAQAAESALDTDHLGRMTHGDRSLEREVLELFDRQAVLLADRLRDATAQVALSCAHTLKGSARGIGAWRLAGVAEEVERVAAAGTADMTTVVAQLVGAVEETRSAIALRLIN